MDCAQRIRKRNHIIDAIVFWVMLATASSVTLTLFYRQVYGSPALYHSDMKAYILEMQGLESGYSFPYPVFFKFAALIHYFTSPEAAVALATMLLNSLGILVTKLAMNHLTLPMLESGLRTWTDSAGAACTANGRRGSTASGRGGSGGSRGKSEEGGEKSGDSKGKSEEGREKSGDSRGKSGDSREQNRDVTWMAGVVVSLVSVGLFFLSMLYPPDGIYLPGIKFKYLGVFTPNPFHNATYMAARPFAILAFLWYVKLLPVYEKGFRGRKENETHDMGDGVSRASSVDYILFAVFLLLATMTKPSFTLVMVSAAGLLMLYRLVRARFRNFVPTLGLGLCFVPTFLDLLYQYRGVFVPEEGVEGGLGFCLGEVWAQYCGNIPLAVCLAVGFPLSVLLMNFRECRKNTLFRFSWLLYVVSFAEAFLLYEKGFRKVDFNFSWGYMYGIFFCHFGALAVLLCRTARQMAGRAKGVATGKGEETVNGEKMTKDKRVTKGTEISLALQWLAFLCHVVCGIFYFKVIFGGGMYY